MLLARIRSEYWAVLKEAKKEGRIRYLGTVVTSFRPSRRIALEAIMRNEPIDFISVDYAIDHRDVEEKILPLAQERKIAVMALFPFGGAGGQSCVSDRASSSASATRRFRRGPPSSTRRRWAQFFLKYVISHPAITVVRVGTTKPHHMLDNIGGGIGRLPNEATRKRMAEFIDDIPLAGAATDPGSLRG